MTDRPAVLVIAGSDSSGGAGLTADQRAIDAQGMRMLPVVTAVTAQGPGGVTDIHPVPLASFRAQLDAALAFHPAAIKVGMLCSGELVRALAGALDSLEDVPPMVVDPVLASTSGTALLDEAGVVALSRLVAHTTLWTPNRQEYGIIQTTLRDAAVLITGGDVAGSKVVDTLRRPGLPDTAFEQERIPGPSVRGTGCTLASAIASELAAGQELHSAVARGIRYTTAHIAQAVELR